MQAATRMADGQWPWRDFGWAYGPGRAAGRDGARQAVRPVAAVVAAAAGGRRRDRRRARLGSRPRRPPALGARRVGGRRGHRRPADERQPDRPGARLRARRGPARVARAPPAWARGRGRRGRVLAPATWAPSPRSPRRRRRLVGARESEARGAQAEAHGAARERQRRCGGLARRRRPRRPVPRSSCSLRRPRAVLYAPFLVAAGPGTVWDALVVQAARDGEWWRLPFPAGFDGGDVKDFATWLAPYAALVTLVLAAFRYRRGRRAARARAPARRCTSARGPTSSTRRRCWSSRPRLAALDPAEARSARRCSRC